MCLVAVSMLASTRAQSPQHLVVPAAYQNTDAIGVIWIPGANNPVRMMTLVGASHLQGLVGYELLAIELRRSAENDVYQGGTANLALSLSTSPNVPLTAAREFAPNIGANVQQVWNGPVTIPASPAVTGTTVPWTQTNVIRIVFQNPFIYTGGTLCVDMVGQPITGQTTDWWMGDAEFENIAGTVTKIGSGCGQYGGPQGEWSGVDSHSLVPGAHAHFFAFGTPGGFALAAFGAASPVPIPLSTFGLQAPGCNMHLQPGLVLATLVTMFVPQQQLAALGGVAEVNIGLPNASWAFGLTLTTQWLDLSQPATSEALQWTIANAMPTLDMAVLEGTPTDPAGILSVHRAHVMRFEYR